MPAPRTRWMTTPLALAAVVLTLIAGSTGAEAGRLHVLETLTCPQDGALRCGDISVYKTSSGHRFLRQYRGADADGRHYFTDRLADGYEVLFVFDRGMEVVTAGSTSYESNNGMTLFGKAANEQWDVRYKAYRKGKFWADVEGRCVSLGDLKTVEAGKFAVNRMVCETTYTYTDGAVDSRQDVYWFHVPTYQIIAWTSTLNQGEKTWGSEMTGLFPVKR